ncbi:sigma 54-interacting transcriptional regulator [bacterium]|nr:sigma 54-interacting transcriptional regulator [bacterium]
MDPAQILIIDDELAVVQGCSKIMSRAGHLVDTALTSEEALSAIINADSVYDVIFLDLKMTGDRKVDLLARLRKYTPDSAIVFILGAATIAASVESIDSINNDFLPKPFTADDIKNVLESAMQRRSMLLKAKNARNSDDILSFNELVWSGKSMQRLSRLVSGVAPTGATLLLIGEPGTGKMRVAETIHRTSPRRLEPFVAFDARRGKSLSISGQIFGYIVKEDRINIHIPGKIEEARNGTLYISEITALTNNDQSRLFTAIKAHRNIPLRGIDSRPLSCRIIFGTESGTRISQGLSNLSSEFCHELSVFPIYIPSLAERSEDIPSLAYQLLKMFNQMKGKNVESFDEKLLSLLILRRWKNNLRELSECVERMVAVCEGNVIDTSHYQQVMGGGVSVEWSGLPPSSVEELKSVKKRLRHAAVAEVDRAFLKEALRRSGGNVTKAAEFVGMQRRNFQTMMKQYGIKGE